MGISDYSGSLTRRFAAPSPGGRGNNLRVVLLPPGEGGAKRRMRDPDRTNHNSPTPLIQFGLFVFGLMCQFVWPRFSFETSWLRKL